MAPEREQVVGMPRDFLAAFLLALLRQWSMHGYRLMQQLMALGFAALDPGTVYRTLRQLEREGLISSHWDLGESGPARRTYRLTPAGEAFLESWAEGLEHYRHMLDAFFQFYGLQPPERGAGVPREEAPPRASTRRGGDARGGAKAKSDLTS